MQTPTVAARRSRRSRKAPEHFATQQTILREPNVECIERMFKMADLARERGKDAKFCICGYKMSKSSVVCKLCGWEQSSKDDTGHTDSLPMTPRLKKKKRALSFAYPKPTKVFKYIPPQVQAETPYDTDTKWQSSEELSDSPKSRESSLVPLSLSPPPPRQVSVSPKSDSETPEPMALHESPLKKRRTRASWDSYPKSNYQKRRLQAWRISQCRIKWNRNQSFQGEKAGITIVEPPIPCDAPWCRRWFFKDSSMLIHKFQKHVRPPYGFAHHNSRNWLEIDEDGDERMRISCNWPSCNRQFALPSARREHYDTTHKKITKLHGRRGPRIVNNQRITKPISISSKTLCNVCSKRGLYTAGLRLKACNVCQKACHINCSITETSNIRKGRTIHTCRLCYDKESRESLKEVEAKIPICDIYITKEILDPATTDIDYINGYMIKSYTWKGDG